jgi:predicted dinucleotide-binding enzyme
VHTVSAAVLADLNHPLDEDVLVCGDRKAGGCPVRRGTSVTAVRV